MIDNRIPAPEQSEGGGASETDALGPFVAWVRSSRVALFLSLAALACSSATEPATPSASVRDSAGVQIVTSTTPAWRDGEEWQVDTVPIRVLGADSHDLQQQWRFVGDAARLSDGSIAVAVEDHVRLFGPDGRFVRRLIPPGLQHGTLRIFSWVAALPGDTLRAGDGGGYDAEFAPGGELIRERTLDLERYRGFRRPSECGPRLLSDGSRYFCQPDSTIRRSATNRADVAEAGGTTTARPGLLRQLHRVWLFPPVLDTAYPLGIAAGSESYGVTLDSGRVSYLTHPFHSRSSFASGGTPLRLAIATNPDYRIELWSMDGHLARIIERRGARRAPTAAEAVQARSAVASQLNFADSATRDRLAARVPTPDSLPAVFGLAIASTGELLVQRAGTLASDPASVWDVFGTDGRLLGSIRLPGHPRILAVGEDYMLVKRLTPSYDWLVEVYRLKR